MNCFGPNSVFRVLSTRQAKLVKLRISPKEFFDFATFGKSQFLSEEFLWETPYRSSGLKIKVLAFG